MGEDPTSDAVDDFAIPVGRGMRRLSEGEKTTFRRGEAARLQDRLDEFDAVRTRGDLESRSAHLGVRTAG